MRDNRNIPTGKAHFLAKQDECIVCNDPITGTGYCSKECSDIAARTADIIGEIETKIQVSTPIIYNRPLIQYLLQ